MSLHLADARFAGLRARLTPYALEICGAAGRHALCIHADEVTPEHLLSALMQDADCAAVAAVVHCFADPETIAQEALAISPGVLVVASDSTLPFSTRGVTALRAAGQVPGEVGPRELLAASLAALPAEARERLADAGLEFAEPVRIGAEGASAPSAPLLRSFTINAKRILSRANRLASQLDETSIGPAQVVLACLALEDALADEVGLGHQRARLALAGRTADGTPPPARELPPDDGLLAFFERLPTGSGSLELLLGFHTPQTDELAQILLRHKVTPEVLQRSRGALTDPERT